MFLASLTHYNRNGGVMRQAVAKQLDNSMWSVLSASARKNNHNFTCFLGLTSKEWNAFLITTTTKPAPPGYKSLLERLYSHCEPEAAHYEKSLFPERWHHGQVRHKVAGMGEHCFTDLSVLPRVKQFLSTLPSLPPSPTREKWGK